MANLKFSKFLQQPIYTALFFWALCVGLAQAQASAPAGIVGEVTLVIGSASLQAADGQTRTVERGSEVRVGDKVETQQGGHVHLRFVDGGRVSVRPASRLVIESYAHSKDQPQLSAIKFRLDEGVIRSITGTWGEAAKERFRLNTPVAAIGVKGTDFVVRSLPTGTAATVFAGAIVVSPLTEKCVGTLGPCINGNEKTLSESMKGQMLELQRPDASPQLVPAVDLQAAAKALYQSQLRMLAAGSEASKDSAKEANKVAANEATKEAVKDSVKDGNFASPDPCWPNLRRPWLLRKPPAWSCQLRKPKNLHGAAMHGLQSWPATTSLSNLKQPSCKASKAWAAMAPSPCSEAKPTLLVFHPLQRAWPSSAWPMHQQA